MNNSTPPINGAAQQNPAVPSVPVNPAFPQSPQAQAQAVQAQALAMLAFQFPNLFAQAQGNISWTGMSFPQLAFVPVPVGQSPYDKDILVHALHASSGKGINYRQSLESLNGVNNHTADQWKDYYLENVHHINSLVSKLSNGPASEPVNHSVKKPIITPPSGQDTNTSLQTARRKLPHLNHSSSAPQAGSSSSPRQCNRRVPGSMNPPSDMARSQPTSSESLMASPSIPTASTSAITPRVPSHEPSPPADIGPALFWQSGTRRPFTPKDKTYLNKYMAWALSRDSTLSKAELAKRLAARASHHTESSWAQVIGNVLLTEDTNKAYKNGSDKTIEISDDDDETVEESLENGPDYDPSDDDPSDLESTDDDLAQMGEARSAFTDTDMRMVAKWVASHPDWEEMSYKEKWEDLSQRVRHNSLRRKL
ncbi:hypothetical protein HETIRDRAFT_306287 [Heterobasidion irregulare TC 32-1]|uniref:Uncharacterized protein n=1 Tax=Heterobasidion irregulare (strain TC 32-1) TaxID=747525 RepID=W4KNI2_HETIT|nr:uncharacterized protein HETIRDRAFT_306287 [Heterobasidion irregulare TC 32-1]ETW86945.1 hypothetical protein HETIRDRAFT_306287 [Heterobasidion irregulare TC 32-1]